MCFSFAPKKSLCVILNEIDVGINLKTVLLNINHIYRLTMSTLNKILLLTAQGCSTRISVKLGRTAILDSFLPENYSGFRKMKKNNNISNFH